MDGSIHSKILTKVLPFECDNDFSFLAGYFQLRSRVFVNGKKWDLFNSNEHELDEYDKETSHYIVVYNEDTGEVCGGARLSPTEDPSFNSPIYQDAASFMIKDACEGLLNGLPTNLCFGPPPTGERIWELTRVVVSDPSVTQALFEAGTRFLTDKNVEQCLALGSPAVMRVAKKYGCEPKAIGPLVSNENGSFLAFSCDVVASAKVLNITRRSSAN